MARIAGIDVPNNKSCEVGLSYIYGIGRAAAKDILTKANLDTNRRIGDLTTEELDRVRKIIENEYTVEGALRTRVRMNIKRLMDIGCFRGLRHRRNMPVRGQRSRTNARTRKGPRKTIAGKKKAPGK